MSQEKLVLSVTSEDRHITYSDGGSWVSRLYFKSHPKGVELTAVVDGPKPGMSCRMTLDEARQLRDFLSAELEKAGS